MMGGKTNCELKIQALERCFFILLILDCVKYKWKDEIFKYFNKATSELKI